MVLMVVVVVVVIAETMVTRRDVCDQAGGVELGARARGMQILISLAGSHWLTSMTSKPCSSSSSSVKHPSPNA